MVGKTPEDPGKSQKPNAGGLRGGAPDSAMQEQRRRGKRTRRGGHVGRTARGNDDKTRRQKKSDDAKGDGGKAG